MVCAGLGSLCSDYHVQICNLGVGASICGPYMLASEEFRLLFHMAVWSNCLIM